MIAEQFTSLVELGAQVRRTGIIPLPGFYRRAKNWDIVVTFERILVAAIECKSQVGSFGNNFNNRTEEAIGNAVDLWRGYEAGYVGNVRPWLGFVFVIEHAPNSTSIVRDQGTPVYRTDPVFDNSSYIDRYGILFDRLVRERLYDATCLVSTVKGRAFTTSPCPRSRRRTSPPPSLAAWRTFAALCEVRIPYIGACAGWLTGSAGLLLMRFPRSVLSRRTRCAQPVIARRDPLP